MSIVVPTILGTQTASVTFQPGSGTAVTIDQDTNAVSLAIDSEATGANVIRIVDPKNTSSAVFNIQDADGLTSASIMSLVSNSADVSARNLLYVENTHVDADAARGIYVKQLSDANGVFIDQDGNGIALNIDSEATTADVINVSAATLTTGYAIDIPDLDALTTGNALRIHSNSTSSGGRQLVDIANNNSNATACPALRITQASSSEAMKMEKTTTDGGFINFSATADADLTSAITTLTTPGSVVGAVQVEHNGTKGWFLLYDGMS